MAIAPDVVCRDWTLHQVTNFFRGVGLGQYVEVMQEHGIDGPILSELIRMDGLDDIGITNKLHKAKVYSHLRRSKCAPYAEADRASSSITKELWQGSPKKESTERTSTTRTPNLASDASLAFIENFQQHKSSSLTLADDTITESMASKIANAVKSDGVLTGLTFANNNLGQARKRRERLRKDSSQSEIFLHRDIKRLVVRPSLESDAWTPSCLFAPHQLAPEVRMQIFDFVPLVELFRLTCTARVLREQVLQEECRLRRLCSDVNFTAFGDTMLLCLRTVSSMARYNLRARRPRGSKALEDVGERLVGLLRVPALSPLIRRLDLSEAPADLVRSEVLWQAIEQLEYLVEVEYPSLGWPDATERRRFEGALSRLVERNKQRIPDSSNIVSLGSASSISESCLHGATTLLV